MAEVLYAGSFFDEMARVETIDTPIARASGETEQILPRHLRKLAGESN